jgi:hypothetical protein
MDVREVAEQAASSPLERLEAEITTQAGHLAAAECRWLLAVAEYDRREGWGQWGCWSCAMWLGWKCGLSRRAAQEKVRVARALSDLPLVTEAFARGELSYSQVRALTRVAEPSTEAGLMEIARNGTVAQLERVVAGMRTCIRRAGETDATNVRHERRYISYRYDDDGSLVGSFRLTPRRRRRSWARSRLWKRCVQLNAPPTTPRPTEPTIRPAPGGSTRSWRSWRAPSPTSSRSVRAATGT